MECLCLFIHHTIWSKNLFRILLRLNKTTLGKNITNNPTKLFTTYWYKIICWNYHESSDCLEYQKKNPYLNQTYPKKYLPKFSYPKKILKSKILNPKKSFNHPCYLTT